MIDDISTDDIDWTIPRRYLGATHLAWTYGEVIARAQYPASMDYRRPIVQTSRRGPGGYVLALLVAKAQMEAVMLRAFRHQAVTAPRRDAWLRHRIEGVALADLDVARSTARGWLEIVDGAIETELAELGLLAQRPPPRRRQARYTYEDTHRDEDHDEY
jgi:hypothetical protein